MPVLEIVLPVKHRRHQRVGFSRAEMGLGGKRFMPIEFMYGIFTYIWRTFIVHEGKYIPYNNSIGMILLAFVGKWGRFVCCLF